MKLRGPAIQLPLLAKELVEQAARPRTYLVRSLYALLFCGFTLWLFHVTVYRNATGPFDVLGNGRVLFDQLLVIQAAGIYLFLPAMMSSVITAEKERSTLGLLILTRLSPRSIVVEKYLSRLLAMGNYLLLTVPALTFCYAIGGLTGVDIATGLWILLATTIQVGAIAILCSSWSRTGTQSFILTYFVCGLLFVLPSMLQAAGWLDPLARLVTSALNAAAGTLAIFTDWIAGWVGSLPVYGDEPPTLVCLDQNRPDAFKGGGFLASPVTADNSIPVDGFTVGRLLTPVTLLSFRSGSQSLISGFVLTLPALASSLLMLWGARFFLIRRAFVEPRNLLLKLFRKLDGTFHRMNQNRFTRGIVLTKEASSLPEGEPIVWRETQKKSLGTVRYLVRVLVALEVPAALVCGVVLSSGTPAANSGEVLAGFTFAFWVLAVLFIVARCGGLVAGERQRETLDVLLSTPLRLDDVVQQKMRGVRRLMMVVGLPIVTCVITRFLVMVDNGLGWTSSTRFVDPPFLYLVVALAAVVIQLPLVGWIAVFFSLRLKSQGRAIFTALVVVTAWVACSIVAFIATGAARISSAEVPIGSTIPVFIAFPPLAPFVAEAAMLERTIGMLWLPVLAAHATMLYFVKKIILHRAAQWLGRPEYAAQVFGEPQPRISLSTESGA